MRASRVMLTCGKRTRVRVYIYVCTYIRHESRGDSRANQHAFVLRMNGNRRAYGTVLTSTVRSCKVKIIRKILKGRDQNLRGTRQSSPGIIKIESLSSLMSHYLYQYNKK